MRPILIALAAAAVLAAPASAFTPAARAATSGSIGLQLVDVPVTTSGDPRARLYIVDHVAPGAVLHRRIAVSNTAASGVPIGLYPAAADIQKGSFVGAAGRTRNELSSWTSVSPGTSELPARGRVQATVTIKVPRDAAPGERYGVVWAEARSSPGADGGITQVSRVGIRLYLSVGPGGAPAADFTIGSLTARRSPEGRPVVVANVRNTGGRALDMHGTLRLLAGPGGLKAGPFPANLGVTLAIGATEPITIALDKRLPAGPWDAQVKLRSGLLERDARATITFPDTGSSPPPYLAIAIAGLALLLLGIAATLVALRRRQQLALR